MNDDVTRLSVPSAVLSVVASFALIMLSHFEHMRSKRSSFLVGFYLTITLLFRVAMVRTYWHIANYEPVASATLASVLVQVIVLGLETCDKSHQMKDKGSVISAESSAGFLSRSLFVWLNPLFVIGCKRTLRADDLHIIDKSLKAAHLVSEFDRLQTTQTSM